jgi:hypothetical protein
MLNKFLLSILIVFVSIFANVYAEEPILISSSNDMDKIIFDGKWSNILEWKRSSYDSILFKDNSNVVLRSAHQNEFIYIQINVVYDNIINKGSDSAILCFDTRNDKTIIPQKDDYCFFTTLNGKNSFTYQGGSPFALNGYFKKIPNHENYISIGNVSDKYDRYSQTPHPSYEFRIPIEILGRSDNYGFYFSTFDASSHKTYSWPKQIETKNSLMIPSPSEWGDIISPDRSLPELNTPIIAFALLIFTIIILQSKQKIRIFSF